MSRQLLRGGNISHMPITRYLEAPIREDLTTKMVLMAGPRQVGKTTLAQGLLSEWPQGLYLNWDNRDDRKEIRAARWPGGNSLVVLDELHKWRGWKGWLKGEFDKHRRTTKFLVTGSARMDVYRRGGDSLLGRFHHYRLHPITAGEVGATRRTATLTPFDAVHPVRGKPEAIAGLMQYGGFPEPFLAQSARGHRRWQRDRLDRVIREDVRDLESIRDLSSLQVLADLLPARVGSPLSVNALREDLEASHRAVDHWIEILERLYYVVRIRPYGTAKVRSLKKMPKAYLWDWSEVPDPGPRFENLVALHLLKLCHFLQDHEGHDVELFYLRDRTGREVDFLVTANRKPWIAVEAKVSDTAIDSSLTYFRDRLKIPFAYQVVLEGRRDFVENGVRCLPAADFLGALI
jgi:predicted AAA+ superfamily ATPase